MFDIGFNPMAANLNGFTTYVMNSDEKVDEVITDFKQAFNSGLGAEDALTQALKWNRTQMSDFTTFDQNRIKRKIEEISGGSLNMERRN